MILGKGADGDVSGWRNPVSPDNPARPRRARARPSPSAAQQLGRGCLSLRRKPLGAVRPALGALPRAGDPRILQLPLPELAPSQAFARRLPGFVGPTPSTNLDARYVTSNLVSAQPSIRNGAGAAGPRPVSADVRGDAPPESHKGLANRPPARATMGVCLKRHPRISAALDSSAAPVAHRHFSRVRARRHLNRGRVSASTRVIPMCLARQ